MLKHLILHNFRRYESAQFQFHPQFTVLIGNNGAGKTTVLDALAMMLNTYFQGAGLPTGGGTIKPEDARFILTHKEGQVFRERQDEVYLEALAHLHGVDVTWRRDIGDRGGKAKELVRLGARGRSQIKEGLDPDLPLLLYYGAGRLWKLHDDVETERPSSQLDAYRYCLDPKSDQKSFEKWFKKLAYSELQKRTPIPATAAVKGAVLACIPGAQDFFHDTDQDQLTIRLEKEGLVPFNSLSDGYRNMVGMVADIALHAKTGNPHAHILLTLRDVQADGFGGKRRDWNSPAMVTPILIDNCIIIDSRLLPLLARLSGRSFSVRVFMEEKRVELTIPCKNRTNGKT